MTLISQIGRNATTEITEGTENLFLSHGWGTDARGWDGVDADDADWGGIFADQTIAFWAVNIGQSGGTRR